MTIEGGGVLLQGHSRNRIPRGLHGSVPVVLFCSFFVYFKTSRVFYICICMYVYIQGVTGGTDQTSGGRSLC